jgi:hypothetical protein
VAVRGGVLEGVGTAVRTVATHDHVRWSRHCPWRRRRSSRGSASSSTHHRRRAARVLDDDRVAVTDLVTITPTRAATRRARGHDRDRSTQFFKKFSRASAPGVEPGAPARFSPPGSGPWGPGHHTSLTPRFNPREVSNREYLWRAHPRCGLATSLPGPGPALVCRLEARHRWSPRPSSPVPLTVPGRQ